MSADRREIDHTHTNAEHYLFEYAFALRRWNAPDDEHTKDQLRKFVERIIDEVFES